MKMQDSNVSTFSMDLDQLTAYVFAHMGPTDEAKVIVQRLASYDRLAIGRYALINLGANIDLTDSERDEAMRLGEEYYNIWNAVGEKNYFEDK